MNVKNQYGQFTDSPVEKRWFLRFDTLFLNEPHRKILNRQPKVKICYKCNLECAKLEIDFKVLSN